MAITTGLKSLDDLLGGGLQPGSLTLYAGESQSGMTTLLDTTVCAAALRDHTPTLLADLEGGDRQVRILSAHSGVKLVALQRGNLTDQDTERLAASVKATDGAALHHTTTRSMPFLLAEVMEAGAKLIAVDGVRYVTPGPGGDSALAEILISLKGLAVDRDAAVVITAPITRAEVHSGDGPSMASLLPEFVLYCDTTVLLRRWGSLWENDPTPDTVQLIVAKNRYGSCGTVTALGDYTYARFRDRDDDAEAA